jgi:ADP-heptose:LPS heptosyltransferase
MTDPAEIRDVAIVLPDMIGTTVCAMPAVSAIYAAFPRATIQLFGFEPVSRFLCDEACGADLVLLDVAQLAPQLARLASPPDLAFDMLGTPDSLGALARLGVRHLVGWPDKQGHVTVPVPFPSGRHQLAVQDYLDFVLAVGAPAPFSSPRLTASGETRERAAAWLAQHGVGPGETTFVLGVGGGNDRKRWPLACYFELEQRLAAHGRSIYFCGPRETELLSQLQEAPASDARPGARLVAARLPLDLVKGIVAGACLAVCNDHAMMHIAAALQVPTVGVFLASDPVEWFPYPPPSRHVVGPPLPCRPCYTESCDHWSCNDPSLPGRVQALVEELMNTVTVDG